MKFLSSHELIKGEDADNIILGDTFSKDGFAEDKAGRGKWFQESGDQQ